MNNIKKSWIWISLITGVIVNLLIFPSNSLDGWRAFFIITLGSIGIKLAFLDLTDNIHNQLNGYCGILINAIPITYLVYIFISSYI